MLANLSHFVIVDITNPRSTPLELQAAVPEFQPPKTTRTFICELPLGAEAVNQYLGASMHVFLLNVPRLEFGALIPKGEYVTVVLLGRDIDRELVAAFLKSPAVRECLPPAWEATTRHKESEGSSYYRHFYLGLIRADGSPKPALQYFNPELGICQWFHFEDHRLDLSVEWLRKLGVRKLRTMLARDDLLNLRFFRSQGMMAGPFIQLEKDLV